MVNSSYNWKKEVIFLKKNCFGSSKKFLLSSKHFLTLSKIVLNFEKENTRKKIVLKNFYLGNFY